MTYHKLLWLRCCGCRISSIWKKGKLILGLYKTFWGVCIWTAILVRKVIGMVYYFFSTGNLTCLNIRHMKLQGNSLSLFDKGAGHGMGNEVSKELWYSSCPSSSQPQDTKAVPPQAEEGFLTSPSHSENPQAANQRRGFCLFGFQGTVFQLGFKRDKFGAGQYSCLF